MNRECVIARIAPDVGNANIEIPLGGRSIDMRRGIREGIDGSVFPGKSSPD